MAMSEMICCMVEMPPDTPTCDRCAGRLAKDERLCPVVALVAVARSLVRARRPVSSNGSLDL
jgi:hypothetical protein